MPTMTRSDIAKTTGISVSDLDAMYLLQKSMRPDATGKKPTLTPEEKVLVNDFLVRAIGNMELNKQLKSGLGRLTQDETGLDFTVISILRNFTYKSRRWDKITGELPQIYAHFKQATSQSQALEDDEKITLSQYGTLNDLVSITNDLDEFSKRGLILEGTPLFQLNEDVKKANEIVSTLQEIFLQEFEIPEGGIAVKDKKTEKEIAGKSMSLTDRVLNKEGSHAAVLLTTKKGPMLSHTDAEYRHDAFTLSNFLYNDVYKIRLDRLVESEMQRDLKKHLGEDWLQQLEHKFGAIQRALHDAERTGPIRERMKLFDAEMEGLSGTWRYSRLAVKHFSLQHLKLFGKDHTDEEIRDFLFARDNFQAQDKEPIKVICSEFVGMCLIATVKELNDNLVTDLRAAGVDVPDKLIRSPLSKREELSDLSPKQLVKALEQRGAIEKVSTPTVLANIVSTKEARETLKGMKKEVSPQEAEQVDLIRIEPRGLGSNS